MTNPVNPLVRTLKVQGVSLVLAFLSLTVAGASLSFGLSANAHTRSLAVCRQHAADRADAVSAVRAKLANDQFTLTNNQVNTIQSILITAFTAPKNLTEAEKKAIVDNFLATEQSLQQQAKALAKERQDNPVPPPANEQCK